MMKQKVSKDESWKKIQVKQGKRNIQSVAQLSVLVMAAFAIVDLALVTFGHLWEETAEEVWFEAVGVLARLFGFEILSVVDISVV